MKQPASTAPVELCKSADEYEASMIVAMLAEHDIQATLTGEFSAGFRAEAPGVVRVYVLPADLPLAVELLAVARKGARPEESEHSAMHVPSSNPASTAGTLIIIALAIAAIGMFFANFLY